MSESSKLNEAVFAKLIEGSPVGSAINDFTVKMMRRGGLGVLDHFARAAIFDEAQPGQILLTGSDLLTEAAVPQLVTPYTFPDDLYSLPPGPEAILEFKPYQLPRASWQKLKPKWELDAEPTKFEPQYQNEWPWPQDSDPAYLKYSDLHIDTKPEKEDTFKPCPITQMLIEELPKPKEVLLEFFAYETVGSSFGLPSALLQCDFDTDWITEPDCLIDALVMAGMCGLGHDDGWDAPVCLIVENGRVRELREGSITYRRRRTLAL